MKKYRILLIVTLICVMLFGSVITTQAEENAWNCTNTELTTDTGKVINFYSLPCAGGDVYIRDAALKSGYTNFTVVSYQYYTMYQVYDTCYYVYMYPEGDFLYYNPYVSGSNYYPRLGKNDSNFYQLFIDPTYESDKLTPRVKFDYQTDTKNYVGYDITNPDSSAEWMKAKIVYSTEDIYSDSSKTSVFYKAPKSTLAPVVQKIQMTGALAEVKKLVPICLACLVGWIALRKGLALLQRILKTA